MSVSKKLLEKGFKITSSAKALREMLDDYDATNSVNAFKSLKITKNGKQFDADDFIAQLGTTFADIGDIEEIIKGVISDKTEFKEDVREKRLVAASKMDAGTRMSDKKGKETVLIELFTQTPNIHFNEFDYKFFENFKVVKGGLLYKDSQNNVHRIFINSKGGIDIRGDLFANSNDSILNELKKDIYRKYEVWCKVANIAWNKMDENDRLEDVFDKGFEHKGSTYVVPTFMRYFIQPRAIYEKRYEKGSSYSMFDHFEAIGRHGGPMVFDDQLDNLSQNWNKITKGLVGTIDKWRAFSNTDDWALNRFKLPTDWKDAELPDCWKEFFEGKAPERILNRLFFFVGACMDANNVAQQSILISDGGNTGKGTFMGMLRDMFGSDICGSFTNECLSNPRFAVFSHSLYKHHILINTEYDGKSGTNSELFKQLTGGDTISCEIKGGDAFEFDTKGLKLMMSSNKICYTKENAIRRRLIPIKFTSNFDQTKGFSAQERLKLISCKDEFFAYCYKIYMTCPFRKSTGEYLVMNPEQEKEFLQTKQLPSGEAYEKFLMKAFSEDPDICDRFKCGDATQETHLNDDFEEIYDNLFEYTTNDEDIITTECLKSTILHYIFDENHEQFIDTFDFVRTRDGEMTFANMKRAQNTQFIAYLEKTKGHTFNARKKINGENKYVVTNIKLKSDKKDEKIPDILE